jgi:hypothetical protein
MTVERYAWGTNEEELYAAKLSQTTGTENYIYYYVETTGDDSNDG